eukprot:2430092-Alexandrium_andersonii.AAC.1
MDWRLWHGNFKADDAAATATTRQRHWKAWICPVHCERRMALQQQVASVQGLSLIHISEPTRLALI